MFFFLPVNQRPSFGTGRSAPLLQMHDGSEGAFRKPGTGGNGLGLAQPVGFPTSCVEKEVLSAAMCFRGGRGIVPRRYDAGPL